MNEIIKYNFPNMDCLKIYPIGDVHLGSLECRESEWKHFCNRVAEEEENSRLILCGDLLDTGIANSKTNVYQQAYTPMQQKLKMCEYLEPVKDKILIVVEGNHERRVLNATSYSPTFEICSKLNIENRYSEDGGLTVLRFGNLDGSRNKQNGKTRPTYALYTTHGKAKTRDSKLGYYIEGVDVTISGHTHEPYTLPKMRYKVDLYNDKIIKSPFIHITVGSWLNWGGYGQFGSYSPPAETIQTILLNGRKKSIDILTSI